MSIGRASHIVLREKSGAVADRRRVSPSKLDSLKRDGVRHNDDRIFFYVGTDEGEAVFVEDNG